MRSILLGAALLTVEQATAQELTRSEALVLSRLIDTLCVDLVEARNGCETAVLLSSAEEPDSADLIIFSDRRAHGDQSMLAVVRSIAFNGPLFGQAPWLEQAENGSLLLQSEQIGIGRTPWTQTLTIAYRDGAFLVAGLRYSTYDRIALGDFACDVNLLTGDWTANAQRIDGESGDPVYEVDESGRIEATRPLLADWEWTNPLPIPCSAGLDAWWAAEPH